MTHKGPQHITQAATRPALRIAIIGGGAAGFFAAIRAKERMPEAQIDIYERGPKMLAKVSITGGGRCNLTNSFDSVTDLKQVYPRGHQLMKRLLRHFSHLDTCAWYEREGVALVTQDDDCVFPRSQDAMSIVRCLIYKAKGLGIGLHTAHCLTGLKPQGEAFMLTFAHNEVLMADRVAITTGGMPRAAGLTYLEALGHETVSPAPSLFTLQIDDAALRALMGCVVEHVTLCIPATKFKSEGPLLITHWGMSGPATLKLSSHAARHLQERDYKECISVNWVNERNRETVEETLADIMDKNPQKRMANTPPYGLPARLWQYLLEKSGFAPDRKWAEAGRKGLNRLLEMLTNDCYHTSGRGTYKEEFVTCGGVSLRSIDPATLESKVCPGLYFAGEVLDIDAVTGGFNLQAAWTTGYIVGESIRQ